MEYDNRCFREDPIEFSPSCSLSATNRNYDKFMKINKQNYLENTLSVWDYLSRTFINTPDTSITAQSSRQYECCDFGRVSQIAAQKNILFPSLWFGITALPNGAKWCTPISVLPICSFVVWFNCRHIVPISIRMRHFDSWSVLYLRNSVKSHRLNGGCRTVNEGRWLNGKF